MSTPCHPLLYSRSWLAHVSQSRSPTTSQSSRVQARKALYPHFMPIWIYSYKCKKRGNEETGTVPGKFTHGICAAGPKIGRRHPGPWSVQSYFHADALLTRLNISTGGHLSPTCHTTYRVSQKNWLIECCCNDDAQAKSPVAGTPCVWSFLTKTKRSQVMSIVHGKIWLHSTQFWFYDFILLVNFFGTPCICHLLFPTSIMALAPAFGGNQWGPRVQCLSLYLGWRATSQVSLIHPDK